MKDVNQIEFYNEWGDRVYPEFNLSRKVKKNSKRYKVLEYLSLQGSATRHELDSLLGNVKEEGYTKGTDLFWDMTGGKYSGTFCDQPLIWRVAKGVYEITSYGLIVLNNSR